MNLSMNRNLITIALVLLIVLPAHGALPKPRPYTGSGLLVIRMPTSPVSDQPCTLVLYLEPEVGRVAEPACGALPLLTQVIETPAGEFPVAVMGKKGAWLKIAYDQAGREGWLKMLRGWDYLPWEEFLPGRTARLLPGLKKGYYVLRRDFDAAAQELDTLTPERPVRIDRIEGDWVHVTVAPQTAGWLRWRDDGGRFLITVRSGRAP